MSSFHLSFIPAGIEHLLTFQPWPRCLHWASKADRDRERMVGDLSEWYMGIHCTVFCRLRRYWGKINKNKFWALYKASEEARDKAVPSSNSGASEWCGGGLSPFPTGVGPWCV